MVNVLIHHKISDYQLWRNTFDASIDFRLNGGERSCRIFRNPDDAEELTLLFEWENMQKAHQFMDSPDLRKRMQQAGVIGKPDIKFLQETYNVHRSAAD
jgi:hypothetical protein